MRRILVCGGRDYSDRGRLYSVLDAIRAEHGPLVVIQGGASGADWWAKRWAERQSDGRMIEERALWRDLSHPDAVIRKGKYGEYDMLAGFRRNQRMLDVHVPDEVVAFPGGEGAADMVARAEKAGVPVRRIK